LYANLYSTFIKIDWSSSSNVNDRIDYLFILQHQSNMTTQTPGFYLLNDTYQLISKQLALFFGYLLRFQGVLKEGYRRKKN